MLRKKERPGGRGLASQKNNNSGMRSVHSPQRSLAAIVIMIVVPVSAVAPFARFFQIVAAGLCLAAVFTVLALGIA